jgi:hypothetical protein
MSIFKMGKLRFTSVIPATGKAEIERIVVRNQSLASSSQDPISKITRAKWTGGVTQAVECLLYKCKALSSNPCPIKKKKKKMG